MAGLLLATLVVTVLVAVGLAVLVAVTVVPLFLTLQVADARGASPARAITGGSLAVLLGLGAAYGLRSHLVAAVCCLLVSWAGPLLTRTLPAGGRLMGRAGRHELPRAHPTSV